MDRGAEGLAALPGPPGRHHEAAALRAPAVDAVFAARPPALEAPVPALPEEFNAGDVPRLDLRHIAQRLPENMLVVDALILRGHAIVRFPPFLVDGALNLRRVEPLRLAQGPLPAQAGGLRVNGDASELDAAALNAALYIFAQAYAALLETPRPASEYASLINQLRFYASMEGGPAPFFPRSFPASRGPDNLLTRHVPVAGETDFKNAVRGALTAHNPGFFTLVLNDHRTSVQVHGEHNPDIGRALYHLSGEFCAALELVLARDRQRGGHETLNDFFRAIANWCFDGSVNQINQYLQENGLSEHDLSLVPNLDGKHTLVAKAGEYVRVFALGQARKFTADTGLSAYAADGNYASQFVENYFDGSTFLHHLDTHESASSLTPAERKDIHRCAVTELALFD